LVRLISHIFENLPEGSNAQWLVSWNREVLLTASIDPSEPHVAAALSGDAVAKLSKLLGQISSVEIPGDSQSVNNSCRT
jgi:hypothetical protein